MFYLGPIFPHSGEAGVLSSMTDPMPALPVQQDSSASSSSCGDRVSPKDKQSGGGQDRFVDLALQRNRVYSCNLKEVRSQKARFDQVLSDTKAALNVDAHGQPQGENGGEITQEDKPYIDELLRRYMLAAVVIGEDVGSSDSEKQSLSACLDAFGAAVPVQVPSALLTLSDLEKELENITKASTADEMKLAEKACQECLLGYSQLRKGLQSGASDVKRARDARARAAAQKAIREANASAEKAREAQKNDAEMAAGSARAAANQAALAQPTVAEPTVFQCAEAANLRPCHLKPSQAAVTSLDF